MFSNHNPNSNPYTSPSELPVTVQTSSALPLQICCLFSRTCSAQ